MIVHTFACIVEREVYVFTAPSTYICGGCRDEDTCGVYMWSVHEHKPERV